MEDIKQLIKEYDNGKSYPSRVTRAANNYIRSMKHYGWDDAEFVNGYQQIKSVKVTVMLENRIQTIWHFDTIQETWGREWKGKIGYRVHSWCDHFDLQVSKEDGNIAYLMIMQKAKEVKGSKVIVETF